MTISHRLRNLFFAVGVVLHASISSGAVIVNETFDSYADTAAMQANWGNAGVGTLDTTTGNGGNSAAHAGGTVNSWSGSSFSIMPSATESIILTADIFDDGTSANERLTVGLRNAANPLFEMGHYNGTTEHYHVRVLNMYGGENWTPISTGLRGSSGQPAGWNRFTATFTASSLTVELDLGADGSIDGTFVSNGAPSANAFVDLRFGGPSNLSSAGGGANFDNIRLETVAVPEPASGLLAAFGIVGGLAFRRRRS